MPQAEIKVLPLPFPMKGLHENSAISEQPEGTTPAAVNVRGYDLLAKRDRGCQRAGFVKFPKAINTPAVQIDLIRSAMLGAVPPGSDLNYGYNANPTMYNAGAGIHETGTGIADPAGLFFPQAFQRFKVITGFHTVAVDSGQPATFTPGIVSFDGFMFYSFLASFPDTTFNIQLSLAASESQHVKLNVTRTTFTVSIASHLGSVSNTYAHADTGFGNGRAFNFKISNTYVEFYQDNVLKFHYVLNAAELAVLSWSSFASPVMRITFGANPSGNDLYDSILMQASALANPFDPLSETICYLQNGKAYLGSAAGGFAVCTPTTSHYSTASPIVDMTLAYGNFWLVDGATDLRKIVPSSGVVSYPAATAGSLPALSRILALYRGRLFHGGQTADPYNYFASRSGDVLDYDYGALDQAGAFAGNDTPQAGLLADYLTAMIPFGDVSMIMGMGSSIAVMQGDPKAGGSIPMLSREIGIASIGAWARSPDGTVYFMSRDGLYRIQTNSGRGGALTAADPAPMSRGRLDDTLGRIDFTQTKVLMSWDPLELGLKIVLVPADHSQPTTIVFWEQRKDAFWVDVVPTDVAPTAIVAVRGSGGPGGLLLYGGHDGWLRQMSAATFNDDGTAISSRVRYGPIQPYGAHVRAKMSGLRQLFGNNTPAFNVVYGVYVADDPVTASGASLDHGGTVTTGGYQSSINTRSRGSCMFLDLSNDVLGKTWQIEQMSITVAPSGRVRA